jgi:hypothetical protein
MVTQSNNKTVTIVVSFFVFMVFLAILHVFRADDTGPLREQFAEMIELLPLNEVSCGRKLKFKKFPDLNLTASERASDGINGGASFSCPINSQVSTNKEYSEIEENFISYHLYKSCISLMFNQNALVPALDAMKSSDNSVTYSFRNTTDSDMQALTYMFLLNPLYVEFNKSEPYVPDYTLTNFFTNVPRDMFKQMTHVKRDPMQLRFKKLISNPSMKNNRTFQIIQSTTNAPTGSSDTSLRSNLRKLVADNSDKQASYFDPIYKPLPIRLYYLEESGEKQITQHYLNLKYEPVKKTTNLFVKNYGTKYADTSDEFGFMNKIFLMMTNKQSITLTLGFSINVNNVLLIPNEKREVMRLSMDHDKIGAISTCNNGYNMISSASTVSNMMSVFLETTPTFPETFRLLFTTSVERNCNANPNELTNNLQIELPYMKDANALIHIAVTVSPVEKIVVAKWDNKYFVIKRTPSCSRTNNFQTLIQNSQEINDIKLSYDTSFVKKLDAARIGHVNYLKMLEQM